MNLRVGRTFYFSKEQTQCFREKKNRLEVAAKKSETEHGWRLTKTQPRWRFNNSEMPTIF